MSSSEVKKASDELKATLAEFKEIRHSVALSSGVRNGRIIINDAINADPLSSHRIRRLLKTGGVSFDGWGTAGSFVCIQTGSRFMSFTPFSFEIWKALPNNMTKKITRNSFAIAMGEKLNFVKGDESFTFEELCEMVSYVLKELA